MSDPPGNDDVAVRSASLKTGVARVTIHGVPHEPGVAARIFGELGRQNIIVDDIIESVSNAGRNVTVSFILSESGVGQAQVVAERLAQDFSGTTVEITKELSRLRVVGMGMRTHSGVAARLFEALAAESINIENISTSEVVIGVLIPKRDGERALRAAQKAFGLPSE